DRGGIQEISRREIAEGRGAPTRPPPTADGRGRSQKKLPGSSLDRLRAGEGGRGRPSCRRSLGGRSPRIAVVFRRSLGGRSPRIAAPPPDLRRPRTVGGGVRKSFRAPPSTVCGRGREG